MPAIYIALPVPLIVLTITLFILYFKWDKPVSRAMKITICAMLFIVAVISNMPRFL